ncbi:MAG: hypothetical protein A2629_00195 [Candidatus Levybacteria bacterium RIFCSPHIGHO2_01_FULL_41_15]|uniref:N-acetyltransferase domain-containing protein n=1 Tax=Candidatus Roizmanbacteria bacterium RIFCSPHIGHO2_12_FULL_33_9 TaxID=1802045 RepID=A0A1F7HG67_9BACT|nr:MAG: hypothetical protein A2629_00195 [Candidatus Levybacteria bacterium RIFCSPHIGHO2_01_FULL_41_15]OGK29946.1 MAG: hypothetical protein A3F29_04565 [Candidatus Roizmanbacteria bacterium RIFCSPHIGHO2_12_FULL_33_9]
MQFQIRPYVESDYPFIKSILQEADMFDSLWDSKENFNSIIKKNPKSILVAVVDNKVIGNIIISPHGSEVSLLFRLAVRKDHRNKGVGTKLLEYAEDSACKSKAKEIGFFVDSKKKELQKYYFKRGYQTRKKPYIFMWKKLK